MKYVVVLTCLIAMSCAQRPFFAGSSANGVPELASRFKTDAPTSTSAANDGSTTPSNIANRLGEDDKKSSTTTQKLPVDARGDADLVNRISQWPRENQPFWYINAQHIEKQRNPQGDSNKKNVNQGQNQTQATANRNSFGEVQETPETTYTTKVIESNTPFDGKLDGKKPKYVEKIVYRYYYD